MVRPEIDWNALLPLLVLLATGVAVLIAEVFLPKGVHAPLVLIGLIGLALAGGFQVALWQTALTTFDGLWRTDALSTLLNLTILVATGLVLLFADDYLRARSLRYGEFYPLLLLASAGAMVMVSSTNWMVIFLGLETLSLALYVLAGLARYEVRSEESALKYFLLGAFASAFLLYGIAMLYGATGSVDMFALSRSWGSSAPSSATDALLMASLALMLVGLGFKASLVPFHMWTPDVYQGAPTVATAYMSAVVKVAVFGVLIRLTIGAGALAGIWAPVFWWLAVLSMGVGNLLALVQRDAKRMLAYSSIAHAGYMVVGLVSQNPTGYTGILYYLVVYSLMSVGAFAVLALMARAGDATTVDALRGLYYRQPFAAHALAILLVSLAGIPPTAGFWGKWYLFVASLEAGQTVLAFVLALTSVIGAGYYLSLIFALYTPLREPVARWRVPAPMVVCLLACILGLVGLGVVPSLLTSPARQATFASTHTPPLQQSTVPTVSNR